MCLIHTNDLTCTVTKIQGLTNYISKCGPNFLMRYVESFGLGRKTLVLTIIHNVFKAQTNRTDSFLDI